MTIFRTVGLLAFLLISADPAMAVDVVATTSSMGMLARTVGGEIVAVTVLLGVVLFDAHDFVNRRTRRG